MSRKSDKTHSFGDSMDVPITTMHNPMIKPAKHPNIPPASPFQKAPAAAPTVPSPNMTIHRHMLKFLLADQLPLLHGEATDPPIGLHYPSN